MRNCIVAAEVNSTDPTKKVQSGDRGAQPVSRLRGTPTAKAIEPRANPSAVGISSREGGAGAAGVRNSPPDVNPKATCAEPRRDRIDPGMRDDGRPP